MPYIHTRVDLILELCHTFPNEYKGYSAVSEISISWLFHLLLITNNLQNRNLILENLQQFKTYIYPVDKLLVSLSIYLIAEIRSSYLSICQSSYILIATFNMEIKAYILCN